MDLLLKGAGWKKNYTMQSAEHKHDDSLCYYLQGHAGYWSWRLLLLPKRSCLRLLDVRLSFVHLRQRHLGTCIKDLSLLEWSA